MNPAYIRDVIKMTDFEEMTKLSGQIRTLSRQITKLSREITVLSGAITRLSRQITDQSEEITSLSGQITDKSGEITSLSNPEKIKQRFEEIITLSEQIKNLSEQIKNLSDPQQIEQLPEQIKNLSEEITNLSDLIKNLFEQYPSQIELYKIYRDYIKHEDSLTNNRLTWLLLVEGFFFTAYSRIVTASYCKLESTVDLPLMIRILSGTGILVAICGFLGIAASIRSIDSITRSGKEKLPSLNNLGLPELTGGNDEWARNIGLIPGVTIPIIIIGVWVYLFSPETFWLDIILFLFIVIILCCILWDKEYSK